MGILIKGKRGGVFEFVIHPSSSYADIMQDIHVKLAKNRDFFMGAEAKIRFLGKVLTKAQKQGIKRLLSMDYDIESVEFCDEKIEQSNVVKRVSNDENNKIDKSVNLVSKDYFNANSVFVSHTLRSGQRVECEGDVVVLGDVNDGAEVIAGGNIAIMGALRGLAHAGAMGRNDVVVAAGMLMPKQLRISGKIAMFPEDKMGDVPEVAEYKQGSIIVKPLKPQKRQIR